MNSPPAYIVIFRSKRTRIEEQEYQHAAQQMEQLAARQPGFQGLHSVRDGDGNGITLSYWRSLEDVQRWKQHPAHMEVQKAGKSRWYEDYEIEIARIEGNTRTWTRQSAAENPDV